MPQLAPRRALALILPLLLAPAVALAQSPAEVAARRGLLEQAQAASGRGDHTAALDLGERAGRISMTPSLRLFLAQEQLALGRLSEALGSAEQCMTQARNEAATVNRDAIVQHCTALARDVRPRVGRVTIQVPAGSPAGLSVTVAGMALRDAFWNVPYVVTPGAIVVEAQAPGHVPFRREVRVGVGMNETVPVALEPAPGGVPVTAGTQTTGSESATQSASTASASAASASGSTREIDVQRRVGPGPAPYIVAGAGAASLLAAGVFALAWRNPAVRRLSNACPDPTMCADTPENRGNYDSALAGTIAVDVALGVGVAAVAGGVVWWLLGTRTETHRERVRASIVPGRDGWSFGLEGQL